MPNYQDISYNRIANMIAKDRHYGETLGNPQSTLRDILTDLRHFADNQGLNFYQAMDGSYAVYLEECAASKDKS